jgi:hypothetical protein
MNFVKIKGNGCYLYMFVFIFFFTFFSLGAVKKGQIVRVDKEKYLNSINVSIRGCLFFFPLHI